jgi:hypothetical protein
VSVNTHALRVLKQIGTDGIRSVPPPPNRSRYARDPWALCDDGHVRILDLETLQEVAFHPYEHQRELASAWIDLPRLERTGTIRLRNVHLDKSRQMGETWALSYLTLWLVSFHSVSGLVQHLNGSEVDDGGSGSTPDSFFGKMRYIWLGLPPLWQAPLDFKMGQVKHLVNPAAYVTGEKATPDSGRGGHYDFGILDEAARIPWGEQVHAAVTRAIPHGRVYNSTPYGEGNVYFRLRETKPDGYVFLTHHWSRHPVYSKGLHVAAAYGEDDEVIVPAEPGCALCAGTLAGEKWNANDAKAHRYPGRPTSPWYEQAILELTDAQVAMELDINYEGSLAARVYGEFSEQTHVLPHIAYDPALDVEFAWDYGLDVTSVIVMQDGPDSLRAIGEVEVGNIITGEDATPDRVDEYLREELANLGVPLKLLEPYWTMRMVAIGDPSGESKEVGSGRSVVSAYRRLGWNIVSPKRYTIERTVIAVKRVLLGKPKPLYVSGDTCPALVRHFKNNRRPTDKMGNVKPGKYSVIDDEHNHSLRALAYYVTRKYPPGRDNDDVGTATKAAVRVEPMGRERNAIGLSYDMKL